MVNFRRTEAVHWIILCHILSALWAQPSGSKAGDLFTIKVVKFQYEEYKWGNELFLEVQGEAMNMLQQGVLNISIYYQGKCARTEQFLLTAPSPSPRFFSFSIKWGPLNEPYQTVLSGSYEIHFSIELENQPPELRKKLQEKSYNTSDRRALEWGDKQSFQREDTEIKGFYRQRIESLRGLHHRLKGQVALALSASADIENNRANPFVVREAGVARFDRKKWDAWFNQEFASRVEKELQIFTKFHKKQFCRRYGKARTNLEEYIFELLRYARLLTLAIYESNNVQIETADVSQIDPFGVEREDAIIQHLESLLNEVEQELEITSGR